MMELLKMASAAARLIAVVVFPTPPFWLATATMCDMSESLFCRRGSSVHRVSTSSQKKTE